MRLSHIWQRVVVLAIGLTVMVVSWPHWYAYAGIAMIIAAALVIGLDDGWRWIRSRRDATPKT